MDTSLHPTVKSKITMNGFLVRLRDGTLSATDWTMDGLRGLGIHPGGTTRIIWGYLTPELVENSGGHTATEIVEMAKAAGKYKDEPMGNHEAFLLFAKNALRYRDFNIGVIKDAKPRDLEILGIKDGILSEDYITSCKGSIQAIDDAFSVIARAAWSMRSNLDSVSPDDSPEDVAERAALRVELQEAFQATATLSSDPQ